ncbi:MAG: hypothetical protein ACE5HO_01195 [bacterium]
MPKVNKPIAAAVVTVLAICIAIALAFYSSLKLDSKSESGKPADPQKAVMAETQAMNKARLDGLANQGKVIKGMRSEQVRVALGEPVRIEEVTQKGEVVTVWWYKRQGWLRVVFEQGKVAEVERP